MSRSLTKIFPSVGRSSAIIRRISELLPAPELPTTDTNSFAPIERLMSSKATIPLGYVFLTLTILITGRLPSKSLAYGIQRTARAGAGQSKEGRIRPSSGRPPLFKRSRNGPALILYRAPRRPDDGIDPAFAQSPQPLTAQRLHFGDLIVVAGRTHYRYIAYRSRTPRPWEKVTKIPA